jgi:hypothetical protein
VLSTRLQAEPLRAETAVANLRNEMPQKRKGLCGQSCLHTRSCAPYISDRTLRHEDRDRGTGDPFPITSKIIHQNAVTFVDDFQNA